MFSRLLFQIKCAYCLKPITQVEERILGKLSLCPACFNHVAGERSQAHPATSSPDFSERKKLALSVKGQSTLSSMHFLQESSAFSARKCKHFLQLVLRTFSAFLVGGREK